MVVRNMFVILGHALGGESTVDFGSKLVNINDERIYTFTINLLSNSAFKVLIGTGEDPEVTVYDTKLSDMVSFLTVMSNTNTKHPSPTCALSVSTTYKNGTEADVKITNIGVALTAFRDGSFPYPILLTKEILAEPITIKQGESYNFTCLVGE